MTTKKFQLERKTKIYVFISHFMSAWGDRMWSFGVGLFLISLSPNSLQLPAVYGFASGGATLFFAGLVGYWVDNTPRLTAARVSLVTQNLLVVACAAVVFCVFFFSLDKESASVSLFLVEGSRALIIIVSIMADLTSIARKIAIEKDWVVEICGRDKDMLASMTSKLRAIDLCAQILAPILTGQVMTWLGIQYGAVLIGVWNLVSVFVEYYLILKVYQEVPALRNKMYKTKAQPEASAVTAAQEEDEVEMTREENEIEMSSLDQGTKTSTREITEQSLTEESTKPSDKALEKSEEESSKPTDNAPQKSSEGKKERSGCLWVLGKVFYSFIALYTGYRTYFKYEVALAGLGLSFLYMTVLGFDKITIGYAYSQGLSEAVLGGLQAAGALLGIMGAFSYPKIRQCVGLERTGLFGLGAEILCLTLCIVSIWTPRSPFNLLGSPKIPAPETPLCLNGSLVDTASRTSSAIVSYNASSEPLLGVTLSSLSGLNLSNSSKACNGTSSSEEGTPDISIWLLMVGIITARFGLWVSDLTITQLFLQTVKETERGIVNSMQNSMNKLMDMLKFVMVIVAPYPHQFGLLVIISYVFICLAWVLYAVYCRKVRGHFFHFEKVVRCVDQQNNNHKGQQSETDDNQPARHQAVRQSEGDNEV